MAAPPRLIFFLVSFVPLWLNNFVNPEPTTLQLNLITEKIVDAAYTVHAALGPGLLESVYETCLAHEIIKRGLKVERQVS